MTAQHFTALPQVGRGRCKTTTFSSNKVDVRVGDVEDGTVFTGSVSMTDESGDVVVGETQTIVGSGGGGTTTSTGAFGMSMSSLRTVTPGTTTDLTVRFDNLQGPGSALIQLPDEMTPVLAVPSAQLTPGEASWTGLPSGASSVKLRVMVDPNAKGGKTISILAQATDATGSPASAQGSTVVRESTTSSGGAELSLSLSVLRNVTAGLTTDITASYDSMQGNGALTMTLPLGMSLSSSVPSNPLVDGRDITWSGLSDASGVVRARVLVSSGLQSGAALPISAEIRDSSGAVGSAAGTTSVR